MEKAIFRHLKKRSLCLEIAKLSEFANTSSKPTFFSIMNHNFIGSSTDFSKKYGPYWIYNPPFNQRTTCWREFSLLAVYEILKLQNLAKKRLTSTDPKLFEDPGLAAWKFRFVSNDPFQRKPLGDPNFPQSLVLRYVLDVATWKFWIQDRKRNRWWSLASNSICKYCHISCRSATNKFFWPKNKHSWKAIIYFRSEA